MNIYKLLLLLVIGFSSCENQILDLDSLTEPVDDIFYKNEEELNLALNGAYNSMRLTTDYKVPLWQWTMDLRIWVCREVFVPL